jgi:hypothetical protein
MPPVNKNDIASFCVIRSQNAKGAAKKAPAMPTIIIPNKQF